MPTAALLAHDLAALGRSWLIRLWIVAAAIVTALILLTNWQKMPDGTLIAASVFPFLVFPWYFVVIALGITPVAGGRMEQAADGILSRPVTRHEFLLAAWLSRVLLVVGMFVLLTLAVVAIVMLAERPVRSDVVTVYGVASVLAVVSLVLAALVSLGFFLGTLLKNTLLALVVMLFVWYPINITMNTFSLEEISPISLNQALPVMLRQSWSSDGEASSEVDPEDIEALAQQAESFLEALGGRPRRKPQQPEFFAREEMYRDIALWRVLLGYGIPVVVTMGITFWKFHREDL